MKTLNQIEVKNKKVLVRVDFNVPMNAEGTIADDTRIKASIPTIQNILDRGGIPILLGHLGRPKGKPNLTFSLAPCAKHLATQLERPVFFIDDCIGEKVRNKIAQLKNGDILLLENLRFYPGEENPESDPSFAASLVNGADAYVDDAFGSAHRAHASIFFLPRYFTEKAGGLLLETEYKYFQALFSAPKRPFFAVIGGGKISSKFSLLKSLISKVDGLFIGGAMAFTLLKAQGLAVGDSLCEDSLLEDAKKLLQMSQNKLFLPADFVVTNDEETKVVLSEQGIPSGWRGMDIGPLTLEQWGKKFLTASTVFWNGPMGVFEIPPFNKGTEEIAKKIAQLSATTVIGGGDSLAAIKNLNLNSSFSHLSTGGGACLEFLEFGHLPGIDALV